MSKKGKAAAVLRKIEENQFRCALSGWEIKPDLFELDHIVPLSAGGTHDVDNIQALHPLVNKAKGTMSNDQFIEMCIAIAGHYKKKCLAPS